MLRYITVGDVSPYVLRIHGSYYGWRFIPCARNGVRRKGVNAYVYVHQYLSRCIDNPIKRNKPTTKKS